MFSSTRRSWKKFIKSDAMAVVSTIFTIILGITMVVLVMMVLSALLGGSWERIYMKIIPTTLLCILAAGGIVVLLWYKNTFTGYVVGAIVAAVLIGSVIVLDKFVFDPMVEKVTERCETGSFKVVLEDSRITVYPDHEVVISRAVNGDTVTIDPEETFVVRSKDVVIWDSDSFSYDLVKYSDDDYDVKNKKLILTVDTAKAIGLVNEAHTGQ